MFTDTQRLTSHSGQFSLLPDARRNMSTTQNVVIAGRSSLVVSAYDCSVKGARFESHRGWLCLSQRLLQYTALGMGCASLLQCLG